MHLDSGLARRRRPSSNPAAEPRRGHEVRSRPDPQLRARASLAPPAASVIAHNRDYHAETRKASRCRFSTCSSATATSSATPGPRSSCTRRETRVWSPPPRLHLADLERAGCDAGGPRHRLELPSASLRLSRADAEQPLRVVDANTSFAPRGQARPSERAPCKGAETKALGRLPVCREAGS